MKMRMLVVGVLVALGILSAQAGTWVYVTNNFTHSVSVIDAATDSVIATIPVGEFPEGLAAHPDPLRTLVYVANNGVLGDPGNTVTVIERLQVIATVTVGQGPRGVAAHPAGTFIYVLNADDETLSVIQTSTNTVSATLPVGSDPGHVIVHPAGTFVYVANSGDDTVTVFDANTHTVITTVATGDGPHGLDIHPAGTFLYVANTGTDNISVVDTATHTVVDTITVGVCPAQPAVHPDGTFVYVTIGCNDQVPNAVSVVDTADNFVVATIPVGLGDGLIQPHGIEVRPDGGAAYVANIFDNSVSVIDTANNTVGTTVVLPDAPGPGNGPVDVTILESDCLDPIDTDGDGIPDGCDPDDDNDGCLDGDDEDPLSSIQVVGTWNSIFCNPSGGIEYGFAGVHSDDDRLLNCMDPDDDGDGIPDEDDPCPVSADALFCSVFRDCPATTWWDACDFGPCVDVLVLIDSLINPAPLVVDTFEIINDTLYLQPAAESSVFELAGAIAGVGFESDTAPTAGRREGGDILRIEIWSKGDGGQPERFLALVAEYDPRDLRLGDLQNGGWLALFPTGDLEPPLAMATSWVPGAEPFTALVDTDADGQPDPFDNCILQPNVPEGVEHPGGNQRDTDGDRYGNACDGDFDNDGAVTPADRALLRCAFVGRCRPEAGLDMNGDGVVSQSDFLLWRRSFEQGIPGPSGLIGP